MPLTWRRVGRFQRAVADLHRFRGCRNSDRRAGRQGARQARAARLQARRAAKKTPRLVSLGSRTGGPSMKGRKSARGSQCSGPSAGSDIVRVQIEAVRQQRAARGSRRVCSAAAQLDHAAAIRLEPAAFGLARVHEVGVVLGGHGVSLVAPCRAIRETLHRTAQDSGTSQCDITHGCTVPMGRYRPPTTPGSKYITPRGRRAAARGARAAVARWSARGSPQAVAAAAAQGDRSENAEYTYGKKRLREIDRRVRFLRAAARGHGDRRPAARAIRGACSSAPGWSSRTTDGERHRYRIVGPDEFDMAPGYISMDSPLGRALLGKRAGR